MFLSPKNYQLTKKVKIQQTVFWQTGMIPYTVSCLRIQCSTAGHRLHYRIYDRDGGFGAKDFVDITLWPIPLLMIWNLNLCDDN